MADMYKKLKKQNGQGFARTIRDHHNGLLEIENLDHIVRHAGRDASELLPYLMTLLRANDNAQPEPTEPEDPFVLLDRAGYDAFYADTLQKQNSIKRYFARGELLCTFRDSARHENYHIVHAVKKNADQLNRRDFKGKEERQDEYGTSVISIQMLKKGGFISIKNRYNGKVHACDNTFSSNPNNIIKGLAPALAKHFNVDFAVPDAALSDDFVIVGRDERIFKYWDEQFGFYYGEQAWAKDGQIREMDKGAGEAMFDRYFFDGASKKLKNINASSRDSFPEDFNRHYGGNKNLMLDKDGNLTLHGEVLIGAENGRIVTLNLTELTSLGEHALTNLMFLKRFNAPKLKTMECYTLQDARSLTHFKANALKDMSNYCVQIAPELTDVEAEAMEDIGAFSFQHTPKLKRPALNALKSLGHRCISQAPEDVMRALQETMRKNTDLYAHRWSFDF